MESLLFIALDIHGLISPIARLRGCNALHIGFRTLSFDISHYFANVASYSVIQLFSYSVIPIEPEHCLGAGQSDE